MERATFRGRCLRRGACRRGCGLAGRMGGGVRLRRGRWWLCLRRIAGARAIILASVDGESSLGLRRRRLRRRSLWRLLLFLRHRLRRRRHRLRCSMSLWLGMSRGGARPLRSFRPSRRRSKRCRKPTRPSRSRTASTKILQQRYKKRQRNPPSTTFSKVQSDANAAAQAARCPAHWLRIPRRQFNRKSRLRRQRRLRTFCRMLLTISNST